MFGLLLGILSLLSTGCDNSSSSPQATGTIAPTATMTGTAGPTPTSSTTPTPGPTPTGSTSPSATPTGTPVACLDGLRQLNVTNETTEPVWVSGGGGALRSVCVINSGASNCLTSNTTGSGGCMCGTTSGSLACPGTSNPIGPKSDGLNCQCAVDSDCGPGAGCNTATDLCYFTLPAPAGFTGFTPSSPWNWELPAAGDTATFCLAQASVTFGGTSIPSAVWWSGGVGARTGCQPDGTSCLTGDCNTSVGGSSVPNADCPVGVGGAQPATIAEFTLQSTATDFYDVTLINGANVGEQMAPIPTATQTPGAVDPNYWCATPGGSCNFNLGQYTSVVPLPAGQTTDYSPLLMLTGQPCTVGTTTGCPANYICSGTTGALNGVCYQKCTSTSQCSTGLQCLPAGDGNSYCQCSAQSDCPAGQFCGSQFVPGIGGTPPLSPQVYLQQCGSFQGWWTADDLCGNANNVIDFNGGTVLNCGGSITDGDSNQTNIASLFGCNGASSSTQAGNPANEASCYNANASPTAGCCGCATESVNPLSALWPVASGTCANNDPVWASDVQPWLANLKQACPSAYSYPFDDFTSTYQCQAQGATNMLGYTIDFTPLVAPTSE